jgi:hypothetical protein
MLTSTRLAYQSLLESMENLNVHPQRLPDDAPVQANRAPQVLRIRNVSPGEAVQAEKSKLACPPYLVAAGPSGSVHVEMG